MVFKKWFHRTKKFDAAHKVFNTFELLETILTEIPPREILVSGRSVCQTWNEVINNSLYIQQRLYYKQAEPGKSYPHVYWENPFRHQVLRLGNAKVRRWRGDAEAGLVYLTIDELASLEVRRLPEKPPSVEKWSWEEMYPCPLLWSVHLENSGRTLRGEEMKLGYIMKAVEEYQVANAEVIRSRACMYMEREARRKPGREVRIKTDREVRMNTVQGEGLWARWIEMIRRKYRSLLGWV